MAAYVVFGDAEAAVCDIIRASGPVAEFGDVTVSTDLIDYQPSKRWVRVSRTGGMPTLWMRLDNPAIALDIYAEDKTVAYDLVTAVRAAVFAACGQFVGRGLALFDVADATGVTWDPDEPAVAHYTCTLALVTRPI